MPQLTEPNRAKLDGIVQQMVANGENDDAINFVVSDFKSKYALPDKPVSAEDYLPPTKGWPAKLGDIIRGVGRQTIGQIPAALAAVTDVQRGLVGNDEAAMQRTLERVKGVGAAQVDELRKAGDRGSAAVERLGLGDLQGAYHTAAEAIGHGAAGVVPLVGPAAAHVGETFETDPYGALGETAGLLAMSTGPRTVPATVRGTGAAARGAVTAAGKVSPLALSVAEHVPVIGGPVRLVRKFSRLAEELDKVLGNKTEAPAPSPNAGGRLVKQKAPTTEAAIADALRDFDQPEVPQSVELPPPAELPPGYEPRTTVPAPSRNAGGRLVRGSQPTVEAVISDALDDLNVPEPPARITTPPPADLPPGYTPRTSVPKPKAAPRAPVAPEPPVEPPAAPPKRAYFLRDVPAKVVEDAVAPSDLSDLSQYPASWQPRTSQDVIPAARQTRTVASRKAAPVTAAEVDEVASSLMAQGLSPSEAMQAVMRNRQLPPELRASLMTALGKLKKRAS